MNERLLRAAPWILLGVAFVAVSAWTWTWPDHPLIPDEAIAKAMVESVATNGTPLAREPITDYRSGTFATDRYGGAYADHAIVRPPVSVAVAFEQGLAGEKLGRLVTLLVGTLAVAFLGHRIGGAWAGAFAGILYATHPATLYFHQSYFANPGGTAWFLASLALLEAGRRWWWLAPVSVAAAGLAMLYRVEYGLGLLVVVPLAFVVLRGWRALVAYAVALAALLVLLWNLESLVPGLSYQTFFTEDLPLRELVQDPKAGFQTLLLRYRASNALDATAEWTVYSGHVRSYFVWFFPLTFVLAACGALAKPLRAGSTWVYAPLAAQTLLQAYAILPALEGFDFSNVSWLESSVVRYFLVTYAFAAILAGVALGLVVERVRLPHVAARPVLAVLVAALVAGSSVGTAVAAEHGVAWANERRAWFDEIEAAAESLGPDAVFVGKTPGKVIFSRPVMNPENRGWEAKYATSVAADLLKKGRPVYALEPWYWNDHGQSMERIVAADKHAYWTDTGVVVHCPCGEFARFYELHRTNVTLTNVSRLDEGALAETAGGARTTMNFTALYPERALHIRMGLAQTRGVNVTLAYVDEGNATYTVGYWNLPLENAKNEHPMASFTTTGTGKNATVAFSIPREEIVNGALYVQGPPGLLLRAVAVTER